MFIEGYAVKTFDLDSYCRKKPFIHVSNITQSGWIIPLKKKQTEKCESDMSRPFPHLCCWQIRFGMDVYYPLYLCLATLHKVGNILGITRIETGSKRSSINQKSSHMPWPWTGEAAGAGALKTGRLQTGPRDGATLWCDFESWIGKKWPDGFLHD